MKERVPVHMPAIGKRRTKATRCLWSSFVLSALPLLCSSLPIDGEGLSPKHERSLPALRGGYPSTGFEPSPRWKGARRQNFTRGFQGSHRKYTNNRDGRSLQRERALQKCTRIMKKIQEEQMKAMKNNCSLPVESIPVFIPRSILIQKYHHAQRAWL